MVRVKKSRKNDPSYRTHRSNAPDTQLSFPIAAVTQSSTIRRIQVDRLLSAVNHRLYRQHGVYRAKVDLQNSDDAVGGVKVYALSTTWYMKRAIQMAKQMHDHAMEEEMAMGRKSRWYDFRISQGGIGSFDEMVHRIKAAPNTGPAMATHFGEYAYSEIRDAAGNDKTFALFGASSFSQYNILEEYDNTQNNVEDPGTVLSTGPYDGLDGSVEEENLVNLSEKGDLPPYRDALLESDIVVEVGTLFRTASGAQRQSTGFFNAPLGLIWVEVGASGLNPVLELTAQSGKYKGTHMEAF